jgi:hypothetical protein
MSLFGQGTPNHMSKYLREKLCSFYGFSWLSLHFHPLFPTVVSLYTKKAAISSHLSKSFDYKIIAKNQTGMMCFCLSGRPPFVYGRG